MRMKWLRNQGLISNHEDYLGLRLGVLEDADLLREAEATAKRKAAANGQRR